MALAGQIAFITGGASGIGYNTALQFLQEGVKKILLIDLNEESGLEKLSFLKNKFPNSEAYFKKVDVTNENEIIAAFQFAKEKFGQIDILVNSAGVYEGYANWKRMVDINMIGVISCTQTGLSVMSTTNGGRGGTIVNISSISGFYPSILNPVYSATKHAIVGLSRSYGNNFYHEKTGVRITAICPRPVNTPMINSLRTKGGLFIQQSDIQNKVSRCNLLNVEVVSETIVEAILDKGTGTVWEITGEKGKTLEISNLTIHVVSSVAPKSQ